MRSPFLVIPPPPPAGARVYQKIVADASMENNQRMAPCKCHLHYITPYGRFWNERLDRFERYFKDKQVKAEKGK
jgi:hypothetical protein